MAEILTKKQIAMFLAIRKVELGVTKSFNEITDGNYRVTIHPATRLFLEKAPKIMKEVDAMLEKV